MKTNSYRTMRPYILVSFLLLAVLCSCHVHAVKFGSLCSSNPNNNKRGFDTNYGSGHYGASRGDGKHKGLDIKCADGATVFAPFDVKLNGKTVPYHDEPKKEPINDGINLSGEGLCFKLFYVKPISYSGTLKKGEKIGTLLPMQKVYPGITSHIHVQMCDKLDPTEYF